MTLNSKINGNIPAYLKLMRVDHWIKNFFMIPGVIFAFAFEIIPNNLTITTNEIFAIIISFLALCFASSANYVMNEWLDRNFDAMHPFKNHRVSNVYTFSANLVWTLYFGNLVIVLIFMALLNNQVKFFLVLLLVMGFFYNVEPFRFKDKHYFDVISESINNPIRLAIGWYAIEPNIAVPISSFIGFWGIGIFLMALKRYAEMNLINDTELLSTYRKSFKRWNPQKLLVFSMVGALVASSFLGIFLIKYRVEYIMLFPMLIWIFAEYLKISLNLEPVAYAPELLMRKKRLILQVVTLGFLFLLLTFIDLPFLSEYFNVDSNE